MQRAAWGTGLGRLREAATVEQCYPNTPHADVFQTDSGGGWGTGAGHAPRRRRLAVDHAGVPVVCARFDDAGELLVSCGARGRIAVHDALTLRYRAWRERSAGAMVQVDPVVHIETGRPLAAACWNPANQAMIAAVGKSCSAVDLYDLEVCDHDPTLRLAPPSTGAAAAAFAASGLSAVAMFDMHAASKIASPATAPLCAAAGAAGAVLVWDVRAPARPAMIARGSAAGWGVDPITSIAVDPARHTLAAGTLAGRVPVWDLRKTSSGSAFGAQSAPRRPDTLKVLHAAAVLAAVPGLAEQAQIDEAAVHDIAVHPCAPGVLLFHLETGWTAAVDVDTGRPVAAHCPPIPWRVDAEADAATELKTGVVREDPRTSCPAWWRAGPRRIGAAVLPGAGPVVAVGSADGRAVNVVNVDRHPRAHAVVPEADTAPGGAGLGQDMQGQHRDGVQGRGRGHRWGPVRVRVSTPATCAAVHPRTGEVAVGTLGGGLAWMWHGGGEPADGAEVFEL
ncbi:unnamed protein product [Pedinophyceae sp. YPF-701]|nr:unnamed protein product [Pedinophyceae sp. YPF-701]